MLSPLDYLHPENLSQPIYVFHNSKSGILVAKPRNLSKRYREIRKNVEIRPIAGTIQGHNKRKNRP